MAGVTYRRGRWACAHLLLLLALGVALAACGNPVTVERLDARTVQTELTSNALTTGRLSGASQIALRRMNLLALFETDAPAAIRATAQAMIKANGNPDLMFAMAEMAFLEGERSKDRAYFLAAVVSSYAYLFPTNAENRPSAFDPRLRTAADLYNRALTRGLASADEIHVDLRPGDYALPFGATLTIDYDPAAARWAGRELGNFIPAAELHIEGLQNRYRETGLGAPLAADIAPAPSADGLYITPALKLPVTALLRLDITTDAITTGRYHGRLQLYPGNEERTIEIGGQKVPLEIEPTASLAYALSNSTAWKSELSGFFQGDLFDTMPTQLFGLEPYRPGRIPVVMVHGTASSAGRWADMINDLRNDPDIRDKFQFWLFVYNTGNPVPLSALRLREALEATVARLDPDKRDPALHKMVLVGHSQGGLLAKLLVVDVGSKLFDRFSTKPLDELKLSDETRTMLRRALYLTPMPDVSRVIFIATPHRGSFRASISIASLMGRFITLPLSVTRLFAETLDGNADAVQLEPHSIRRTSVYAMTPGSPFATTTSTIPVAPSVAAHSIIAVAGDGPVETGDDGVVKYESAHIDEAKSELVVRSTHSVQANPLAVAEVKRILQLHWAESCPVGCYPTNMTVASANPIAPRPASIRRAAAKQP